MTVGPTRVVAGMAMPGGGGGGGGMTGVPIYVLFLRCTVGSDLDHASRTYW